MARAFGLAVLALCGCGAAGQAAGPARPLLVHAASLQIQAGNLAAADVNGDGRDDLLVPSGRSLHVMIAGAGRTFARAEAGATVALPEPANEIALGDLNHDGKLDAVTAGHDSYAVTPLLGDGAGGFTPAPGSPVAARDPGKRPHTHGLALTDVNGDRHLDVLTVNQDDDDLAVLLGDGNGGFARAPRSPFTCGPAPYPFAMADFDGDGNGDVLVPNTGGAAVSLLRGDGKGAFAPRESIPVTHERPFFVAAGDLTGDGKPDAVVTHDDRREATVLVNDGRGRLARARSLDLGGGAWTVVIRDADGDGKPDLVVAARDAVRVMLGDSRGAFTPAPGSPYPTGKGTWRVAAGDFNADGKLDVAATCVEEGKVVVLKGN